MGVATVRFRCNIPTAAVSRHTDRRGSDSAEWKVRIVEREPLSQCVSNYCRLFCCKKNYKNTTKKYMYHVNMSYCGSYFYASHKWRHYCCKKKHQKHQKQITCNTAPNFAARNFMLPINGDTTVENQKQGTKNTANKLRDCWKKKGGGRHYTDPFLTKKVRPGSPK